MVMAGSDIIKNDGMYAAYVLASDLMGNGRYNIKIKARSVENVTQVVVGGKGRSSGALDPTSSGSFPSSSRPVHSEQHTHTHTHTHTRARARARTHAPKTQNSNKQIKIKLSNKQKTPEYRICQLLIYYIYNFIAMLLKTDS